MKRFVFAAAAACSLVAFASNASADPRKPRAGGETVAREMVEPAAPAPRVARGRPGVGQSSATAGLPLGHRPKAGGDVVRACFAGGADCPPTLVASGQ